MNDNPHNNNATGMLDYLIICAKHSRVIGYVSVAAVVLTYLVLFVGPNEYSATASLLPPQQNLTLSGQILDSLGGGSITRGFGGAGFGGGMAAGLLGLKSSGDLYVSMMSGNTVFDRIIQRFDLRNRYRVKYIEDARKKLGKEVKINVGKKDNIITVKVTTTSPQKAANMANAFCEELGRILHELSLREAKGRLAFLEKERIQTIQNLTKAEEALRSFSENNSVLQIDTQTRAALEYIARLRAEIDSKEVSIQVLRQQATPYNYDMVRMETEIKGLKEKLRSVECQHDSNIPDVCLPTNKTPGLALEYIRLYREAKFQESLYQLYIKLVEIARIDIARGTAVIQVVDMAKPPERRGNRRLLPSVMAGMLTFVLMIVAVLGYERIQNITVSEEDAQRLLILKNYFRPCLDKFTRIKNVLGFRKRS
jgi:capsule polysaccharide export protein KpsE/RkpR